MSKKENKKELTPKEFLKKSIASSPRSMEKMKEPRKTAKQRTDKVIDKAS